MLYLGIRVHLKEKESSTKNANFKACRALMRSGHPMKRVLRFERVERLL